MRSPLKTIVGKLCAAAALLLLLLAATLTGLFLFFLKLLPLPILKGLSIVCVLITVPTAAVLFVSIRKIRQLRQLCEDFRDGRIYQDFIQEIGVLLPSLDSAVSRLDGLLDRQQVLQLSTKQAEFLALQNQINPHFLYNTLESIRGDALAAGMEQIADITEALSTFFRYTITETRNLVTLSEELDNIDNYFVIQQYRFGDKLSMVIEIADDRSQILNLQCPKLFLQPIIENAIFHGIEHRAENGRITIHIEIIDNEVRIEVSDNGIGIDAAKLRELNEALNRVSVGAIVEEKGRQKGGIALKNVCRRIKLLFGEQYGLHISSIVGIGTKVEVTLPIIEKSRSHAD